MELRIKPFPKNSYPKKGLLIKGSSPLVWLNEMEILGIDLHDVQSFRFLPQNRIFYTDVFWCLKIWLRTKLAEILTFNA